MALPTRFSLARRRPARSGPLPERASPAPFSLGDEEMNPRLYAVARQARSAAPQTRIGLIAEILRTGPYRGVPIVDPLNGRLLGMAGEADVAHALLGATDPAGRARVREMPVSAVMTPPLWAASPSMRASEAMHLFDQAHVDVLPVIDAEGTFLGLIARSDLVQDLVRPFRPPVVGGMATPLGVYLTTGAVSGGVGTHALVLSGLVMFAIHLLAQGVSEAAIGALGPALTPAVGALPGPVRVALSGLVVGIVQFALFLAALRASPVAGFHAAEHQVVHALERTEPLTLENVRAMPRVHPRCGTNLVAGVMILLLGATILEPLVGLAWGGSIAGAFALAYWRHVGAWLQQHFTTKPASDAQIRSGITAAQEVLRAHSRAPFAPVRPHVRLWHMGFVPVLCGFGVGYGLYTLVRLTLLPGLPDPLAG